MTEYTGTDNLEVMAEALNYNKFLVDLVLSQAKKGDCILDFGAGIGTFAKCVLEQGYNVSSLEPDPKLAALLTSAGHAVYMDLNQISDNSLDYIYTLNVLEHIEDDQAVLRECYRKLKPGGRLLIYVPAFKVLFSTMDYKVKHFRRYTKRGLSDGVKKAGFNITDARYVDFLGFWATMLYKLGGDKSGSINRRALVIYDRMVFPLSRIMDRFMGSLMGKNVLLVGVK